MYYGLLGLAGKAAGSAYGTLTTAWIAATGETDLTILGALNTLETDLTTYGLTAKMTALYPFAGGNSVKHSYNFMNTAANQLSFVGGWTHSSTGALPNGTNAYANTGILASSFGTDYMLNFYSRTNSDGLFSDLGAYNETNTNITVELLTRLSGSLYMDIPRTNDRITVANSDSRGNYIFFNNSSNGRRAFRNSTSLINTTYLATAMTNKDLIFSDWGNLAAPRYSNRQLAFGGFGSNFTATDAANYYTAVQTFQTTLGRQVGVPIPFALPLDTYSGAAAAYSAARRLATAYTGSLIRVRRSSDNAEQDIGYTAGNVLDESALTTFVGANNGFITTWYDQSGNAKNMTQSTAISQPQIVSSGTILTQSSKPKISWVSTKWMTAAIPTATRRDIYFITNNDSDTSWLYPDDFGGNNAYGYVAQSGSASTNLFYNPDSTPALYVNNALQSPTTRDNVYTALNGYKLVGHENFRTNLTGAWNAFNIGKYTGFEFGGSFQEIIIYNSNQSANRTGINTNINTFYSIY